MNSNSKLVRLARNWLAAFVDPRRLMAMAHFLRYVAHWRRYRIELIRSGANGSNSMRIGFLPPRLY